MQHSLDLSPRLLPQAEDASAAILSLQQTLVEKLSTKEAALENHATQSPTSNQSPTIMAAKPGADAASRVRGQEAELQNSDPSAIISALDSEIAALNAQLSTQQTKQREGRAVSERWQRALFCADV
eukprot:1308162-Rhodomonas_salina.2